MAAAKKGLYANIQAKRKRIEHGSGEKMRKPGMDGAPASDAFAKSEKTSQAAKSARRSTAAKKTAVKKTAAKKTATKKVTAKKVAAKKGVAKKSAAK